MFRLLPWPSAIGGNKIMEDVKLPSNCAGVNSLSLPNLKRKRSGSYLVDAPATTKVCTEEVVALASQPSPPLSNSPPATDPVASPAAATPTPTATDAPQHPPAQAAGRTVNVDHLRDVLTGHISLEILLKHNEIRLIDQELAKCQIALEQLRRCAEIPYPGSNVAGMSADVSAGTGASLMPGNGSAPVSPAPWGVTEGAYARHYARWLLPDPRFDGELDSGLPATPVGQTGGRSTRGNPIDFSALAGKTRPQRGSHSKLNQLPSESNPVKEVAGPMIIRRKADQMMVKLQCQYCHRENFSSTQGFINHVRIGHTVFYTSHEDAAVKAGVPVELDGSGAVIAEKLANNARSESTPVHWLIKDKSFLPTPWGTDTPWKREGYKGYKPNAAMPTPPATGVRPPGARRQTEPAKAHPSFLASSATPHLSALTQRQGLGLDLRNLVDEVKSPVDLSGDEFDGDAPTPSAPAQEPVPVSSPRDSQPVRQPMRMPTARSGESRKGPQLEEMTPNRPLHHPAQSYPSHISSLPDHTQSSFMDTPRDTLDHPSHLSPNTIESGQAPSLVSDYEDDYGEASDSYIPSSSEVDEDEEEFRHIEVQDDESSSAPSAPPSEHGKSTPIPETSAPLPMPLKQQSRPGQLSTTPSLGDRGRDNQQINSMRDNPFSQPGMMQNQMNLMRPDYHPSEDPSKKNGDVNGRNQSPSKR